MIDVMKRFTQKTMSMGMPWRIWLMMLVFLNMVCPLFFIGRIEAVVVLAAMMINASIMMALFARLGYVRLLGLGHIFWIPLVIWLLPKLGEVGVGTLFGAWLVTIVIVDILSLLIDGVDVLRYIRGERSPA